MFFEKMARHLLCLLLVFGAITKVSSQQQDHLSLILKKELDRNVRVLHQKEPPLYLLTYRVDDITTYSVNAVFGNLIYSDSSRERILTIQVRLGDYNLDNFGELKGDASDYFSYVKQINFPLDDNSAAIQQILWRETDLAYREAFGRYEKVKANRAARVENDDKSPAYSSAGPYTFFEPPVNTDFDIAEWEQKMRLYSGLFNREPDILGASSTLRFSVERKYFVNSEGTSIVQNRTASYLHINGLTQAEDGMELPLFKSYFAHYPEELPQDQSIIKDVEKMISTLLKLRSAPQVDSYTGPAILSNEAAGVFFHEIFGHRVEGSRMKSDADGQTFKQKTGEPVLNTDLTVIFDPSLRFYHGMPLNGSFFYDEEGTPGDRVEVVKNGILSDFLMTRTPIDYFPKSNGHARAEAGYQPVSRQSNLIVQTSRPYSDSQLRQLLLEEAKAQGKEYGYLFQTVTGGFTTTGRYYPNSFNVNPLEVYRIFVDGREDELVRGVDLVGTPLAMFSQIGAAGSETGNFAGMCGAESGIVPVSCCSPALFVKRIEMQKKAKSSHTAPLLSRLSDDIDAETDNFETLVFKAMKDEINRNLQELSIEGLQSPYYISYLLTDAEIKSASSTLGSLVHSFSKPYRDQETQLFVGTHQHNNLHYFDENSLLGSSSGGNSLRIPKDNSYRGVRNSLWSSSDREYKKAAEAMESKKSAIQQQNLSSEILSLPDFGQTDVNEYNIIKEKEDPVYQSQIENLSLQLSTVFLDFPDLVNSGAEVMSYRANVYYSNSEGIRYVQPFLLNAIRVYAETLSADGELLMDYFTVYTKCFRDLPSPDELITKARNMAGILQALRTAPVMDESYSGPVIFTGEAVGEIVAQTFIENKGGVLASRKNIYSTPDFARWYAPYLPAENTLENMVGKKVISRDLSLIARDRMTEYQGVPLIGSFVVDAEGVQPGEEFIIIKDGVLNHLLSDRIPTFRFPKSTGHKRLALSSGRMTTSLSAGVLELTAKNRTSYEKMKKKLISFAKEEDYEYAYIIPKLASQNSSVPGIDKYRTREGCYYPLYMIRVTVKDGSETWVRMGKVSALNLKSFRQVEAVSRLQQVYNTLVKGKNKKIWDGAVGFSGVPVSFIVPDALLFRELEIEKDRTGILRTLPAVESPLKP